MVRSVGNYLGLIIHCFYLLKLFGDCKLLINERSRVKYEIN